MTKQTRVIDVETLGRSCIKWEGEINAQGYGVVSCDKKRRGAHRVLWERTHGPLPNGLVLDHLCRNRACVNLSHLEVVTNKENVLRGISFAAINSKKTTCPRGHKYDALIKRKNGSFFRECRICRTDHNRRYRKRLKEAQA